MGWSTSLQRLGQKQHQRSMLGCRGVAAGAEHRMRGEVVEWYLPVTVVDEKKLSRSGVGK